MTAAFIHPERRPAGAAHMDVWVAVAEFTPPTPGLFSADDLDALVGELVVWRATGLWCDDRYLVQLSIAAPDPYHAVRVALDCHRLALTAVGFAPSVLLRVEVMTAEELERSWDELEDKPADAAASVVPEAGPGVHCRQLYAATRALLAAATAADVARVVDDFVVSIGGHVRPGPAGRAAGVTDVDLAGDGETARHASAEAFSMAGLLLEEALPALLVDADRALRRLRIVPSGPVTVSRSTGHARGPGETR